MFKFFNRPSAFQPVTETEPIYEKQKTAILIEQIHNEFKSAADELLKQATEIIETHAKEDLTKGKRLAELGFTSTPDVLKKDKVESATYKAKVDMSDVTYFKNKYPLWKYIREDQVKQICEKYNLVMGEVSRYTGFVPNKNIAEIEAFTGVKIAPEDMRYEEIYRDGWGLSIKEISYDLYKVKADDDHSGRPYRIKKYSPNTVMMICAPLKDMKVGSDEEVKGYKISKIEIPDPVVLFPVRGNAYLIVTAWGDEASDPLVVNEVNN